MCHIHGLWKFEEDGRCETHKDCHDCKKAAIEICIKDILTLAVWDDKLVVEFRKMKGNYNTEGEYVEADNTWDLENGTKEACMQKQTLTKEDIHEISLHRSCQKASSDSFIKSCTYCGKGHKQGQCPPKDKTYKKYKSRPFSL